MRSLTKNRSLSRAISISGMAVLGMALLAAASYVFADSGPLQIKTDSSDTSDSSKAVNRPNIVVILADDLGYGSINPYGAPKELVQTPALDRLAAEGKRFTNAYTASSVCSPTRYALLTGRYAWRTSLQHGVLNPFAPLHIGTNQLNVASLLKKHQYRTAAIGKWHLGYGNGMSSDARTDFRSELKPGPLEIGFDYHFGVPSNHGDRTGVFVENRYVYGLRSGKIGADAQINAPESNDIDFQASYDIQSDNPNPLPAIELDAPRRKDDRVMNVLTKKTLAWLEQQNANEPFFLYYTPVAVHNPVTPSQELAGKSKAGEFGDWIQELDRSVDAILKKLDEKGLAENTLVLFTSDNGGVNRPENLKLPQTKAIEAGLAVNGSLHGGKHTVWEGGFRVPYIVRWPGRVKAGTVSDEIVSVADLLATTASIVGEPLPAAKEAAQDSYNVLAAYTSEELTEPLRRDVIVHSASGVFSIRKGPWKWIEGVPSKSAPPAVVANAGLEQNKPQLYNLKEDPAETHDVSEANPDVVAELKKLLETYRQGGYSREIPNLEISNEREVAASTKPAVTPSNAPTTPLAAPTATGKKILAQDTLGAVPGEPWKVIRGEWLPGDGGLFGSQPEDGKKQQGALLQLPLSFGDGTVDYQFNLKGADRHVLRIATSSPQDAFRIEYTSKSIAIIKTDSEQKGPLELARRELNIDENAWHDVRVVLAGDIVTVAVGNEVVSGKHELIARRKSLINFVVFGKTAGIKNVVVQE